MKVSSFSVILIFAALMVVGVALVPGLDVGVEPTPRQGHVLTVTYDWDGQPAKVVEQSLTSVVEGLISPLRDVENVSSTSYFGHSEINVTLKEKADVAATRFQVSSILRQVWPRLPQGVSYPALSGGESVAGGTSDHEEKLLLTWMVNADMPPENIKSILDKGVVPQLRTVDGVARIEVAGVTDRYFEVSYNPDALSACGLTASDIADGLRNWLGRNDDVGTVTAGQGNVLALRLGTPVLPGDLAEVPIGHVGSKTVWLGNLAQVRERSEDPQSYYRVNGLQTVYLNVYMPATGKAITTSDKVQRAMQTLLGSMPHGVYFNKSFDAAETQRAETTKLISRTLLSLAILLLLVWLTSLDWRYTAIIAVALLANLLLAVIAFRIAGVQLHVYSLAGITVSLGLLIDATIVMADHYVHYRDRKAFMSLLAAMSTTIGAMVAVFFLPKELRDNLWDFALVVIINLALSLLVALLLVPALIEQTGYVRKVRHDNMHAVKFKVWWNRFYRRYLWLTSRYHWVYYTVLVLAFGLPLFALPPEIHTRENHLYEDSDEGDAWYARLYNATIGSDFYQTKLSEPLSKYLGGTMRLFAEALNDNQEHPAPTDKQLHIVGQMPVGGTAVQLNEKVLRVEDFLKQYMKSGIREFTTRIDGGGAEIVVSFKKDKARGNFPYQLENGVISKLITIGGADWATWGVSDRGFSNSLDLQHRDNRIRLAGYNYDQLYRLAEQTLDYLQGNVRVRDLTIETPGHENQEDEFYMRYRLDRSALYDVYPQGVHNQLADILQDNNVGVLSRKGRPDENIVLRPVTVDSFDLWHLSNQQLTVDSAGIFTRDLMSMQRREAKNVIPRDGQQYVLDIAFNILGTYTYASQFMEGAMKHISQHLPVGYTCEDPQQGGTDDSGTQWWLIVLIALIVYWICAIHFESLMRPIIIISVVPVAMIGVFLTFWLTGIPFGSGGFASLVMLMGITVNSGIYIFSQYDLITRHAKVHTSAMNCYMHAYNHKITPVTLTVLSTIGGLIPFFFDGTDEPFWFSFATGVTSGLLFSLLALILVMPLFVRFKKRNQ